MIRILVADERPLVRAGIGVALGNDADLRLAAEAESAEQAVQALQSQAIELIILGTRLGDRPSLDVFHELHKTRPEVPVLFLSLNNDEPHAARLIHAGANGYLPKSSTPSDVVHAVHKVMNGEKHVTPGLENVPIGGRAAASGTPRLPHETLSDRELQVVCSIASGKSVSEIAQAMTLSVKTVSTYRARALEKMQMRTNAELTRYAILNHLA
jgi:DNA-binding NarL/FixJ family response regulator